MIRYRPIVPDRKTAFPGYKTPAMERALLLNVNVEKRRRSLNWGFVNVIILGILLYDLSFKCPIYTSWFNYIEYAAVTVFSLNIIYHFIRYIYFTISTESLSNEMKESSVTVFTTRSPDFKSRDEDRPKTPSPINNSLNVSNTLNNSFDTNLQCTPLNWSAASWRSGGSPNESPNVSLPSPQWIFHRNPQDQKPVINSTPQKIQFSNPTEADFIADEKTLQSYLLDYEQYEKAMNANNPPEQNSNLLSTFWSHPVTQNANEIAPYLRKAQYQLSSQTPTAVSNTSGKSDETRSSLNESPIGTDVWRRLQIDPETLTQWNANLRMWISQTILDRLVSEINTVNEEFQRYHLNDVRIGSVGLDRLRKTAQTMPVAHYIPTLTTLLPFLEVTPNQEYFVKRIKELAKGGCMSEFKWCSGGSYNGKEWDDSLVNDSEIIVHLLATYLDCQLVPLPNQPDAKPFSKEHFIRPSEKVPHNPLTLAVHQVTEKPPHFRLIVGEEVFEVAKGHNNLFYTVLLFLFFVSKKEHGMLGKVNMGRSGVNMLWIIDEI